MCGRFTLASIVDLTTAFPWASAPDDEAEPRYNIAPSQPVLAATNQPLGDGSIKFNYLLWGLVPSWAKDAKVGYKMINARAETLAERPAFRTPLRRRRCLIPADGFYEWRKESDGKTKTPMYISLKTGGPFAFAGLWDVWHAPDGSERRSCTIITTAPNALMKPIHDRMPAILPPESQRRWLAPEDLSPQDVLPLLRPYPAERMRAYAVSRHVNNPANDKPACLAPAAAVAPEEEMGDTPLFEPGTENSK